MKTENGCISTYIASASGFKLCQYIVNINHGFKLVYDNIHSAIAYIIYVGLDVLTLVLTTLY